MVKQKDHRLTKSEIDELLKKGTAVRGSFFFFKAQRNQKSKKRIAILISKNVAKSAVARTTMRRRLRHVIVDLLTNKKPIDIVFIITGSILRKAHEEIKSEIDRNMNKIFVHK